jgi:hypothetical protein
MKKYKMFLPVLVAILSGCSSVDGFGDKMKFWESSDSDNKTEVSETSSDELAQLRKDFLELQKEVRKKAPDSEKVEEVKAQPVVKGQPTGFFTNFSDKEYTEFVKMAENCQKEFFESIEKKDYKLFVKNMSPKLKNSVTKDKFLRYAKDMSKGRGIYKRGCLLGVLKSGVFVVPVFKVEFEKKKSKVQKVDEVLFRLVFSKLDDKYVVWSFNFN